MILVDSNIWFDVITQDATWFDWSSDALKRALNEGAGINQIIMAEISAGFADAEAAKEAIHPAVVLLNLPWDAAHLAGSAFRRYRQRHKGTKTSPMPDFYIYAHCAIDNMPLLTRDRGKQPYFPNVKLIHPEIRPK